MKKTRGRPPKPKSERKEVDLRIPVTWDQKDLIAQAAKANGEDMAGWARPILLNAALHATAGAMKDRKVE
jgi:uncharacterized protein (DUF1778 family)